MEIGFIEVGNVLKDVKVYGSFAYLADWTDGLVIIDISDPTNPLKVGSFQTGDWANAVSVSNNLIFIADWYDGLYIIRNDLLTSIDSSPVTQPEQFVLYQNYPNPFNATTKFSYYLPKSRKVTLKVYNTLGQLIATLINSEKNAGNHSFEWNAEGLPTGIYFYRFSSDDYSEIKKMILLK
jgi:hypothetical protein